jgi:Acetyltransferase (GNAT) domain
MLYIRRALINDATDLLHVHRDAVFTKAAGFYDQTTLEYWSPSVTPERVACMEQDIADPDSIGLVAHTETEILGFALTLFSELSTLYVKPNPIGHVGHVLLAEIEKQAYAVGIRFLVCDASLNAEEFYKRHGYKEIGREAYVSANGNPIPAIQMRKDMISNQDESPYPF